MMLTLTQQQQLIESSVLAFLENEYDFHKRARSLQAPDGCAPEIWQSFAEMGWLGLPLAEEAGGLGGGALDIGLLMRAFGRYLVVEPYVSCVLHAARLLAELGRAEQQQAWLPAIVEGRARLALAHDEPTTLDPWAPRATRADSHGDAWRLHGRKLLAMGAPGAARLLVTARIEGDSARQAVFLVPPDAPGLSVHACATLDGGRAADLVLDGVEVGSEALLGDATDASPVLHRLLAEGLVALCWEATGAMSAALEQTAAYVQDRVQFGQPIAKFQVVQHRLAEMAVCCEEARAACELASLRIEGNRDDALAVASMVKSKVGRCARFVAQEAVQLHGAMGVSEELAIPSYFRKLLAFQQQGGTTAWHTQRHGSAALASGAWRQSQTLPGIADTQDSVHPSTAEGALA